MDTSHRGDAVDLTECTQYLTRQVIDQVAKYVAVNLTALSEAGASPLFTVALRTSVLISCSASLLATAHVQMEQDMNRLGVDSKSRRGAAGGLVNAIVRGGSGQCQSRDDDSIAAARPLLRGLIEHAQKGLAELDALEVSN